MKMENKNTISDVKEVKLKFSMSVAPAADKDELLFARQLGFDYVYTWVNDGQSDAESLKRLKDSVESAGLGLYNVGNMSLGKNDKIHLALPGRDKEIERFKEFIYNLGKAGIHTTTFTWEPSRVWTTARATNSFSRGAISRIVDINEVTSRPYTHERKYSAEEIWDNYSYFIKEILPVANEAKVRLALHPNDPPAPEYGGIPSLIHNSDCYKKAFGIADNPGLGMEFCAGCWLEGGKDFGDILEGIRYFTGQKKIFIVHFRNISSPMPHFTETFLDNGYMDMYKIMKALCEAGYDGTVTLDHTPVFAPGYDKGTGAAYAIGYMRALLERAKDELGLL